MADTTKTTPPEDQGPASDQAGAGPAQGAASTADDVFPEITGGETTGTVIESMVGDRAAASGGRNINAMLNVGLNVQVVLGNSRMSISQLLELSRGAIIELDKKIGAPVDLVINERLIARGDLVKVGEDRIGVTLTEIVKDYVSEL
jgi:flagellar motor switch protein FliN/FliY